MDKDASLILYLENTYINTEAKSGKHEHTTISTYPIPTEMPHRYALVLQSRMAWTDILHIRWGVTMTSYQIIQGLA